MDINALLSPDDGNASSASASSSPAARTQDSQSPVAQRQKRPAGGKRTASGLSQELTRSPERKISPASNTVPSPARYASASVHQQHYSAQPAALAVPNFRPLPPTSNPVLSPESHAHQYGYVQQRPVVSHRPSSTPQMETLADVALMQQRQQTTRTYSANSVLQETQQHRPQHHPPQQLPTSAPPIVRSISRQSLADLTMAEAPSQTPPPRDFTSHALSESESQRVTELLSVLAETSYAYDHHVELISLLHKGFLAHVYPPADSDGSVPPGEPHSYVLLNEMRQAREAMDTRFAVGEDIWTDWLSDETLLARTSDERIAVTELFQKAVADEPASVRLWNAYVDWVASNYAACHGLEGADDRNWTTEDKEMCKELFTRDMVASILEQAVAATQWRIDESHVLWNRYAQVYQEQMPQPAIENDINGLHQLFFKRLQVPHSTWNDTMQIYWPIISKYEDSNWEAAVARVNQTAEHAKAQMGFREQHEFKLQRALQSGDKTEIHHQFTRYLKDEKYHHKRPGPYDHELRCALFERALLREPTNTEWWLDYVDYLITGPTSGSETLLPQIERATRHCPWSGDLWARRILRADVEQKPRDEIESTKHRATNAGLLDVGGMEELVKMLQEWCSYLRRHAFRTTSAEDDLDTAEVGITMAIEDVQEAGKKLYGPNFQGDPLFRLEQIQIKFYSEARRIKESRDIFLSLASRHGHSFDFWTKYYNWEIWLWGYDRIRDARRVETDKNGPDLATNVIQEALKQNNLDWPEKALELYLNHFQQHESGLRLQRALAEAREFSKRLALRRAKEAEEAAAVSAQQQEQLATAAQIVEEAPLISGEKRKRDDEAQVNGDAHKKAKTGLETVLEEEQTNPSPSASTEVKRDREHNTITVRNLPVDVTENDLKKFFRDCGNLPSISIMKEKDGESASATVEFETPEDILAAKTRSGKELNGREVRIQSGTLTTLYVTNYPAEYDEDTIRGLFKNYGEIVSVRLPSLKFNNRRRFCYVNFLTAEMAKAAEGAMDNKKLDKVHTLVAKISNPDAKKDRSGAHEAQSEGREIIVKNFSRNASEQDIRQLFEQYGRIERLNVLKLADKKTPMGTMFITYSTADEAAAAVEGTHNKPVNDRIIRVEVAQAKGRAPHERAKKEDVMVRKPGSTASPEPGSNDARRGSDVSMNSATNPATDEGPHNNVRERKISVINVPDTVNDARIRALFERFGELVKIQLWREKNGAIIEFANVSDAYKARMGDASSLDADAKIVEVSEMMKVGTHSFENKKARENGTAKSGPSSSKLTFIPPQAGRPGLGRGGRRGGLGFKRGCGFTSVPKTVNNAGDAGAGGGKKSNSDFRSMLEASKGKKEASADKDE